MNGHDPTLARASRPRAWEFVVLVLAFAAPVLVPSHAPMVSEIAITALFAVSLDLVLGYAGIVSLGHAAFFGLGAYGAALFAKHVMPDPLVGLAMATLLGAALAFACSFTILRGSDLTRLMVTLGAALIMYELANKLEFTGGADGLQGVVMGKLLGVFEFDLTGFTAAYYALAVGLVWFLVARRVVHSPFGWTLRAIRDNRLRAQAIGIPVAQRLVAAYTLAGAMAGTAGGLLAQTTAFASIDVFAFERSADLMLMLVIGGAGWLYGGVFGAIVFKVIQDRLSAVTPQYWMFWIGLMLVILMLVGREKALRPWTWFGRGGAGR